MIASDTAHKFLSQGYVLSRRGKWVALEKAVDEEEKLYTLICNGNVIQDGRWVDLNLIIPDPSPESEIADKIEQRERDSMTDQETKVFSVVPPDGGMRQQEKAPDDESSDYSLSEDAVMALEEEQDQKAAEQEKPDTVLLELNLDAGKPDESSRTADTDTIAVVEESEVWGKARGKHRMIIIAASVGAAVLVGGVILIFSFVM